MFKNVFYGSYNTKKIEAEKQPEITDKYPITSVPTLLLKNKTKHAKSIQNYVTTFSFEFEKVFFLDQYTTNDNDNIQYIHLPVDTTDILSQVFLNLEFF